VWRRVALFFPAERPSPEEEDEEEEEGRSEEAEEDSSEDDDASGMNNRRGGSPTRFAFRSEEERPQTQRNLLVLPFAGDVSLRVDLVFFPFGKKVSRFPVVNGALELLWRPCSVDSSILASELSYDTEGGRGGKEEGRFGARTPRG
jgi:hypothetical protein